VENQGFGTFFEGRGIIYQKFLHGRDFIPRGKSRKLERKAGGGGTTFADSGGKKAAGG